MKLKEIKKFIALIVRKEKNWDKNKITEQVGSICKY
jgi:hypothetical protein